MYCTNIGCIGIILNRLDPDPTKVDRVRRGRITHELYKTKEILSVFSFRYFSLASCKLLEKFQNRFSKKNQSSSYTLYFILWNCSEQWFSFWSLLDCKKIKYSSVIFLLQNLWRGKRIFKLFFISLCFLNLSDKFTSDIVFFAHTIIKLRECIKRKL